MADFARPALTSFARILLVAGYTILMILMLFPVYWLIVTSLKPANLEQTNPPVFFTSKFTLANYRGIFTNASTQLFMRNSIIVALFTVLLTLVAASLAAYSLAKTHLTTRTRQHTLLGVLLVRIFPPIVVALPYFTLLNQVHLTDTRPGLILTHVAITLPFAIWLLVGFFQDLPGELDEAGMLDGCTLLQRFLRINLPLVLPGLAVTGIFTFILSWNEYLFASILTSFHAKTLPVEIAGYVGENSLQWGAMTALATVMLVVPAVLAIAGQRYMVRGLTFGAIK